ncbi:MAG: glycoside hydrolase family 30 protein, partial [Bacteroidota bacterium]
PGNTPSMTMTSAEQATFVKSWLGPAFRDAGVKTKIVVYDHNCDHPDYPIEVLSDPQANAFIDGSAFHLYLGDISAMGRVHQAFPGKNVYFTEQWTSGQGDFGGDLNWHVKNLVIGAVRNWSRTVLEWNLANDENFNPHTGDGGCTLCQGAITINSSTGAISRNVSYYIIAHASRFVPAGAVRIGSELVSGFPNVAFLTPAGKKVLIVLNDSDKAGSFSIGFGNRSAAAYLEAGAVGTYVW